MTTLKVFDVEQAIGGRSACLGEYRYIDDAMRALAFFQREESRFEAERLAECRAVDESLERLRAIGRTNRAARKILLPRIDGCAVHFPRMC